MRRMWWLKARHWAPRWACGVAVLYACHAVLRLLRIDVLRVPSQPSLRASRLDLHDHTETPEPTDGCFHDVERGTWECCPDGMRAAVHSGEVEPWCDPLPAPGMSSWLSHELARLMRGRGNADMVWLGWDRHLKKSGPCRIDGQERPLMLAPDGKACPAWRLGAGCPSRP